MSHVNTMSYRYRVCPFCKSKRIKERSLAGGIPTLYGCICLNCNRFHTHKDSVYKTDRAEVYRDIKKLQKFLAKG